MKSSKQASKTDMPSSCWMDETTIINHTIDRHTGTWWHNACQLCPESVPYTYVYHWILLQDKHMGLNWVDVIFVLQPLYIQYYCLDCREIGTLPIWFEILVNHSNGPTARRARDIIHRGPLCVRCINSLSPYYLGAFRAVFVCHKMKHGYGIEVALVNALPLAVCHCGKP